MGRLILVKHAMPIVDTNVDAREWQLSPSGRNASCQLADRLRSYKPNIILSSKESKATGTARAIAERANLPVEVVPGIHEHDRRGVPWMETEVFHATVREFFNKPSARLFGRESADEAYDRFRGSLFASVDRYKAHNVVVVTHGTVIALYVSRLTGVEPFSLWKRLGLPSFVVLSWPEVKLLEIVDSINEDEES